MMDSFAAQYAKLENKFRQLAATDGTVYVPNPVPSGPADFIFLTMEPSLGRWARNDQEAAKKWIETGFRNFHLSIYDFILHYSIRKFLCAPGEAYHVTDISKGAMLTQDAKKGRKERWSRWYTSLLEEIELLKKPNTNVISIGGEAELYLRGKGFNGIDGRICHFSIEARGCWKRALTGREGEFETFARQIDLSQIRSVADQAMSEAKMPADMRSRILQGLPFALSDLHRRLLFSYKTDFQTFAKRRAT